MLLSEQFLRDFWTLFGLHGLNSINRDRNVIMNGVYVRIYDLFQGAIPASA
jgi:hypothetical protein